MGRNTLQRACARSSLETSATSRRRSSSRPHADKPWQKNTACSSLKPLQRQTSTSKTPSLLSQNKSSQSSRTKPPLKTQPHPPQKEASRSLPPTLPPPQRRKAVADSFLFPPPPLPLPSPPPRQDLGDPTGPNTLFFKCISPPFFHSP